MDKKEKVEADFLDTEVPKNKNPEAPKAEKVYVFVGRVKHDSEVFENGDVAKGSDTLIEYWLSHGVVKLKGE